MGDVFLKLFNMSITAGWFILAVLCIRLVFENSKVGELHVVGSGSSQAGLSVFH